MSRRRRRLPKGGRTARLGVGGIGALLLVCLVVAFTAIGNKYVSRTSGQTVCEVPDRAGGPGVEVSGDSTLLGLAHALSDRLAGGKVVEDVKPGRTVQQGEGEIIAIATAIMESRLVNLSGGDRDSVGLFQQRPSQGWAHR